MLCPGFLKDTLSILLRFFLLKEKVLSEENRLQREEMEDSIFGLKIWLRIWMIFQLILKKRQSFPSGCSSSALTTYVLSVLKTLKMKQSLLSECHSKFIMKWKYLYILRTRLLILIVLIVFSVFFKSLHPIVLWLLMSESAIFDLRKFLSIMIGTLSFQYDAALISMMLLTFIIIIHVLILDILISIFERDIKHWITLVYL